MTIEDPIEFLHRDKKSLVNQREVEVDTKSFALRPALGAAPGPRRDPRRRDARLRDDRDRAHRGRDRPPRALDAAHARRHRDASTASSRSSRRTSRSRSASSSRRCCKAVVSMRLVPRADGNGRVPAVEVLRATPYIRDCIENKEKTKLIRDGDRRRHLAVRHADVRPVAVPPVQGRADHLRRGAAAGDEPGRVQAARSPGSSRPPTWRRGDGSGPAAGGAGSDVDPRDPGSPFEFSSS